MTPAVALPLLALIVVGCGFCERPLAWGAALVYRALVAWVTRGTIWTAMSGIPKPAPARRRARPVSLSAARLRRHPPLMVVRGRSYRVRRSWLARVLLWTQRQG